MRFHDPAQSTKSWCLCLSWIIVCWPLWNVVFFSLLLGPFQQLNHDAKTQTPKRFWCKHWQREPHQVNSTLLRRRRNRGSWPSGPKVIVFERFTSNSTVQMLSSRPGTAVSRDKTQRPDWTLKSEAAWTLVYSPGLSPETSHHHRAPNKDVCS